MLVTGAALAYIPSPSNGTFSLGPLTLHMYGVMLLLGIAACIWLTGRRWVSWGGDWDLVFRMALWGVIAGVVGARLYHDITSWNQDPAIHAHWYGFAAVWDGGLGIWGAIPLGVLAGAIVVKRSGNSVTLMMDAVAPGLLLAQGIGRWGNYWNQELYGRPTTLPWGLKIDPAHQSGILARYQGAAAYQPTFLYEFVWDLIGVGVLLWIDRRFTIKRPGALRALRRLVHDLPHVRGAPADRPLQLLPPRAGQLLGLARSLDPLGRLLRLVAVLPQPVREAGEAGETSKARPVPSGPRMAVPKGRVR